MLLRLLTIRLTYRIANTSWEPRIPPIFCGMKGNGLLLIIKPQTRSDSGQMRCWLCPGGNKSSARIGNAAGWPAALFCPKLYPCRV